MHNWFSARGDKSLDDSLTNIQWLCELESSELLSQRASRMKETADEAQNRVSPSSPNPHPKPPYSYATMILLAINSTEDKRMTLQDIYKWIENNYPYYKKCKKAWKVSDWLYLFVLCLDRDKGISQQSCCCNATFLHENIFHLPKRICFCPTTLLLWNHSYPGQDC